MPLFELHASVWNYHIGLITNTNAVANKPPICKNKGCCYWQNNNKHTLFSQKNKDKSNDVTWGFLNIISGWCSIRFTPAFSTPAIYSFFFHSCIFHPCNFARIAFSTPAFSVTPLGTSWLTAGWKHFLCYFLLYPKPDIKYCYSGLVLQWITAQRAKFVEADCSRSTLLLRPKSTSR